MSGVPSKIPLKELLELTENVQDKNLRQLLIVIGTKIDQGFSGMHIFISAARKEIEDQQFKVKALGLEVESLEKRLEELERKSRRKKGDVSAAVALARHEGALEAREKDKHLQLEWAKLSVPMKVAAVTATGAVLAAVAGAIIHALAGS